jgi:hypothetical protein
METVTETVMETVMETVTETATETATETVTVSNTSLCDQVSQVNHSNHVDQSKLTYAESVYIAPFTLVQKVTRKVKPIVNIENTLFFTFITNHIVHQYRTEENKNHKNLRALITSLMYEETGTNKFNITHIEQTFAGYKIHFTLSLDEFTRVKRYQDHTSGELTFQLGRRKYSILKKF